MTILWDLASSIYVIAANESIENSEAFVWNSQSTILYYSNVTDNHTNASNGTGEKGEEEQKAEVDDRYRKFYELAQFITGLVFYPTFCLFGLTGNILSVVVLRGRKTQSPTNAFLIALSVSDGIKLLNDLLYFIVILALHIRPVSGERLLCVLYPYAHYFLNMSVCITAWITVALAAERYILVCHAARAKQICNITRTHVTIAMVFVSMTVISIPSALRYKTVYHYYSDNSGDYDTSINASISILSNKIQETGGFI